MNLKKLKEDILKAFMALFLIFSAIGFFLLVLELSTFSIRRGWEKGGASIEGRDR